MGEARHFWEGYWVCERLEFCTADSQEPENTTLK